MELFTRRNNAKIFIKHIQKLHKKLLRPKKQYYLCHYISCIIISRHESLTLTSKIKKALLSLILELLTFYTILLALKVFYIIPYILQNFWVGLGLDLFLTTVLIYYFPTFLQFIIACPFNPRIWINKVITIIFIQN